MLTVYLDMDGVLADFDKKVIELIGKRLSDFPDSKSGWEAINHIPEIYSLLEPMPDADELVSGVFQLQRTRVFNIGILTAIPKIGRVPNAKIHKRNWIEIYYPKLLRDFNIGPHAQDKQKHCRAGDVLIDDSLKNIPQWNHVGGYGILHLSASNSLTLLEDYLKSLK